MRDVIDLAVKSSCLPYGPPSESAAFPPRNTARAMSSRARRSRVRAFEAHLALLQEHGALADL